METAQIIVGVAAAYLGVGAVFALVFVIWGVGRVDGAAARVPLLFRALVFPASAALWPLMLARWTGLARAPSLDAPGPGPAQRVQHLVAWLVVGPLALAGVALAVVLREQGISP